MEPAQQKIIIVEDNMNLAEIYKTRLEAVGYTCFLAYNGITALYFIQKEIPDLVLLDLMIPDIAGDQVLATMRKTDWGRNIPVFVISNLNESEAPANLRSLGIDGYIVKANMTNDMIEGVVRDTLKKHAAQIAASTPEEPAEQPVFREAPEANNN